MGKGHTTAGNAMILLGNLPDLWYDYNNLLDNVQNDKQNRYKKERKKAMVKHIILWKLRENIPPEEKIMVKKNIKENLESLSGKVPGLMEITVQTDPLPSSNADVMLDCTLDHREALAGYQIHPEHVRVADTYVRPYTEVRMCMDYETE